MKLKGPKGPRRTYKEPEGPSKAQYTKELRHTGQQLLQPQAFQAGSFKVFTLEL